MGAIFLSKYDEVIQKCIMRSMARGCWVLGTGEGAGGAGEDEGDKANNQCPMPNAQCPMPNAQCPMPNNKTIQEG